jgi:hypothetical protein
VAKTNHLTIIRPDRIERYEVTKDTRIGDWLVDAELLRGAYLVMDPELMLGDEMCFQASETPKEAGNGKR